MRIMSTLAPTTTTSLAPASPSRGGDVISVVVAMLQAVSTGRAAQLEWRRSVARGDDPAEAVKRVFEH
jgi:hypothetical protein